MAAMLSRELVRLAEAQDAAVLVFDRYHGLEGLSMEPTSEELQQQGMAAWALEPFDEVVTICMPKSRLKEDEDAVGRAYFAMRGQGCEVMELSTG
jgi:hypothetical protein